MKLQFFELAATATLKRRRLRVTYWARSKDETTERELSPQRLVFYRGNWYLDAWCHLRAGLRSFSIDSIRQAELLDARAKNLPEAELEAFLASGYGIYSGILSRAAAKDLILQTYCDSYYDVIQSHSALYYDVILSRIAAKDLILQTPGARQTRGNPHAPAYDCQNRQPDMHLSRTPPSFQKHKVQLSPHLTPTPSPTPTPTSDAIPSRAAAKDLIR